MTLRSLFAASLLCWGLTACGLNRGRGASATPQIVPGTYRIEICRGPCAADAVLARGYLVLERESYSASELPDTIREYFETRTSVLLRTIRGRPNACFVLTRLRTGTGSYGGLTPVGLTLAEVHGDSLGIMLYRSPDASYHALLHVLGGELRGRGISSGAGDAAVTSPDDSVHARRIGAPQRSRCVQAAEVEAAALRARMTRPAT
jgi:hypothetical protein